MFGYVRCAIQFVVFMTTYTVLTSAAVNEHGENENPFSFCNQGTATCNYKAKDCKAE